MSFNLPLSHIISTLAMTAAAAIVLHTSPVKALSLSNSTASWSNSIGGTNITFPTIGSESQVRWGIADGSESNSGLGFTGVGASSIVTGTVFQLGTLRHFNNSILPKTALSAVDFNLDLTFADAGGIPQRRGFSLTFNTDETVNVGPATTCPYPSTTPCSDKIFFSPSLAPVAFKLGRVDYTLQLLGFSEGLGTPIATSFISDENQVNTTFLYGRIAAVPLAPRAVPEPGMLSGFASFGLYFVARQQGQRRIAN